MNVTEKILFVFVMYLAMGACVSIVGLSRGPNYIKQTILDSLVWPKFVYLGLMEIIKDFQDNWKKL